MAIDVSRAIGYVDDDNGRRAVKRHVPQKYMMRFEDVKDTVKRHVRSDVPQDDAILLKESDHHCFLLRCKMPGAEPFMEWVVETVFPQEVRKLGSAIEIKNAALAHRDGQIEPLEFNNEEHQQEILRLNEEINDLIANRHVVRHGCFDNVLSFIKKKNSGEVDPYYVIQCQYRQVEKHKRWLRLRYPNMEVADECDDPMQFTDGVDLSVK